MKRNVNNGIDPGTIYCYISYLICCVPNTINIEESWICFNKMGQSQSQAQNRNKRLISSTDIPELTLTTQQSPSLQEESLYSCVSTLENVGDIETILKAIQTEPEGEDP